MLNDPIASAPSRATIGQFARSTGQSRFRCGQASGSSSKSANVQRQKDRAAGGTRSRAARPTIEFPAQNSARSEEHTSELQSLMRISYAVFCLKKKTQHTHNIHY